jgi:hypothetical protein
LQIVHALLGSNGIGASQHLDERVSLILVYNACLNPTEAAEDSPDLTFCAACATYKECATQDPNVVAWQIIVPLNVPRLTIHVFGWAWLPPLCWRGTLAVLITLIAAASCLTTTTAVIAVRTCRRVTIRACVRIVSTIHRALATIRR